MSVAEALARAREISTAAAKPQIIPSLLHDSPSAAAAVSRSELAGLALNGLESLSTVDPALSSLHEPLLLLDPRQDRATLRPSKAAELSAAVVKLATRLAPVFPLRHAQKALEWVIRGLNVSTLGSDEEVNAILLAALPFHATPAFAKLVRAVLLLGPTRTLWKWLEPVVKQRKPIALPFLVSNVPTPLLYVALDAAAVAVKSGVSAVSLSGFLGNVIARRLASDSMPAAERRILLLRVLDTIALVRKEKAPSKRKAQGDVLCALFMSVAAAIPRGIEEDVSIAAAQTACSVLLKVQRKTQVSDTVLACFALLITKSGVSRIPFKSANYLISSGILPEILPRLNDAALIENVYLTCAVSVIPKEMFKDEHVDSLFNALSVSAPDLLTDRVVAVAMTDLLNVLSLPVEDGQGDEVMYTLSSENHDRLISLISNLARGRNSLGIDNALRSHFGGRSKRKSQRARYSKVDEILTAALAGTSFQVLKGQSAKGNQTASSDTLLGMLSHHEPVVRQETLERLASDEVLLPQNSPACKEKVAAKLSVMLSEEADPSVSSLALACLLKLCDCFEVLDVLKIAIKRLRTDFSKWKQKRKKTKLLSGVQGTASHVVSLCEQNIGEEPLRIFAAMVGLILDGTLAPDNGFEDSYRRAVLLMHHKSVDRNPLGTRKKKDKLQPESVKDLIVSYILKEPQKGVGLLKASASWESEWGTTMMRMWFSYLESCSEKEKKPDVVSALLEALHWMWQEESDMRAQVPDIAIEGVSTLCELSESDESRRQVLDQLWAICALGSPDEASRRFLQKVVQSVGLNDALDMLRRAVTAPPVRNQSPQVETLKWYFNLHNSSKLREKHSITILDMLRVYFSDDIAMREEVTKIAVARKRAVAGKKKKKTDIDEILAMIASPQENIVHEDSRLSSRIGWIDQLRKFVLRSQVRQRYPLPIFQSAKTASAVLKEIVADASKVKDQVALLRAFRGIGGIDDGLCAQLWGAMSSLLEKVLQPDPIQEAVLESLARITLLLSGLPSSQQLPPNIEELGLLAISQLRAAQNPQSSDQTSEAEIQLVVLSSAASIFRVMQRPKSEGFVNTTAELLEQFLGYSAKSSSAGECARQIVDHVGVVQLVDVAKMCLQKRVAKLPPIIQGKTTNMQGELSVSQCFERDTWLGAVEATRRFILTQSKMGTESQSMPQEDDLIRILWEFTMLILSQSGSSGVVLSEEIEYEVVMVMDVLELLLQQKQHLQRTDNELQLIVDASVYPGVRCEVPGNVSTVAFRNSSLKLLEVLIPGNEDNILTQLERQVEEVVQTKTAAKALSHLQRVVPALLRCNCDFKKVCRWLATCIYQTEHESQATDDELHIVTSCCQLMQDLQHATSVYIQEMFRFTRGGFSTSFIAQECSLFLLSVDQDALGDIRTLSKCDSALLGDIVKLHVLHPNFIAKLLDIVESDLHVDGDVTNAFTELFLAMLNSEEDLTRRESMSTLLAVLPLQLLQVCVIQGISSNESRIRQRALHALADRLEAEDLALSSAWNLTNAASLRTTSKEHQVKSGFVRALVKPLCNIIQTGKYESTRSSEVELSVANLELICKRMGSIAPRILMESAPVLITILEDERFDNCLSNPISCADYGRVVSGVLRCLSSMIRELKKHSIAFTPLILSRSVMILQSVFGMSSSKEESNHAQTSMLTTLAEAAIRACATVLESNPKFFGRATLQVIMTLTLTTTVDVLNDLMFDAVQKVPSSVFVASAANVTQKFESIGASFAGVRVFLKGLEVGIKTMKKSELKLQSEQLVRASFRCLEYGREFGDATQDDLEDSDTADETASYSPATQVASWRLIDEEYAHALTTLVLRLSESEFKPVFKKIVQWSEAGQLGPRMAAAAQSLDASLPQNLLRAVPFYRFSLSLFETLQSLYVPYFLQLVDKVLLGVESKKIVRTASTKLKANGPVQTKKRSRSVLQVEDDENLKGELVELHDELREVCLDNLIFFLKQDLDESILTSAVVSKLQLGIIRAFDEEEGKSNRVRKALDALGACIVAFGNGKESKEESRDLLKALSREILLRTRSENASIREASLQSCKSIATVVGSEFLVALPETMPVLSEVIDDEDIRVQRAAKSLAQVLEDLAGEPILSELK